MCPQHEVVVYGDDEVVEVEYPSIDDEILDEADEEKKPAVDFWIQFYSKRTYNLSIK